TRRAKPMATTAQPSAPPISPKSELTIVSHSGLFYWWPVWAIGLIMGVISMVDGHRLAIVPNKTEELSDVTVKKVEGTKTLECSKRDVLMAPEDKKFISEGRHIAAAKNVGVVFCVALLLVITITNIPLRGLWSVIVIVVVVFMVIIFALMG